MSSHWDRIDGARSVELRLIRHIHTNLHELRPTPRRMPLWLLPGAVITVLFIFWSWCVWQLLR